MDNIRSKKKLTLEEKEELNTRSAVRLLEIIIYVIIVAIPLGYFGLIIVVGFVLLNPWVTGLLALVMAYIFLVIYRIVKERIEINKEKNKKDN